MPFSEEKASKAIKFFERVLTHTKGEYAGKPFLLYDFQRDLVSRLFGTVRRDGLRQYGTCYVEIPKKSGKSEIGAGIALYGLFADGEPGVEIYSAAATRDQAGIVFRVAAQMVRNSPVLREMVKIIDSTKTIVLKDQPSSFYRAISADAGTQDGCNPHMVVFDEIHRQKSRDLWDILKKGMSTRRQPLMFGITTAGVESESQLCWELHQKAIDIQQGHYKDKTFLPVVYSLPEAADWTKEGRPAAGKRKATGWYACNPALGKFKRLDKMREEFRDAQRSASSENAFRRFELCQWVTAETRWLPLSVWDKSGRSFDPKELEGRPCFLGVDLSATTDLTAAVALFPMEDGRVRVLPKFWLPRQGLLERSKHDDVRYEFWAKQGFLDLTDGDVVDYTHVLSCLEHWGDVYDVKEIAVDPWNALKIQTDLVSLGFTVVTINQRLSALTAPTKELERLVRSGLLEHNNHPILRWNVDCCTVYQDGNGNIKPVKPDRLKSKKRIDGVSAMVTGLARVIVQPDLSSLDDFLRESPVIA